jgi:DNA-directed RNA polymerase specialized sigma24 family protein
MNAFAMDDQEFRVFAEKCESAGRAACRACGIDGADADDVLQDAWCRALANASSVRSFSAAASWYARIVRNCCQDRFRGIAAEQRKIDAAVAKDELSFFMGGRTPVRPCLTWSCVMSRNRWCFDSRPKNGGSYSIA